MTTLIILFLTLKLVTYTGLLQRLLELLLSKSPQYPLFQTNPIQLSYPPLLLFHKICRELSETKLPLFPSSVSP